MARLLRVERQLTVDELAKRLALPRSTIYYWVRDLPLRGKGYRAARLPARGEDDRALLGAVGAAAASAYEEGLRSYDDLSVHATFRDFVCVYITEGYKRDRSRVALANADPAVMRLAHRWIWRLTDKSPWLSVHCRPDQSVGELRRFWSETVGEEERAIRLHSAGEDDLQHRWGALPVHGVLAVAVDDSALRARLQAWMRRVREGWR